MSKATALEVFPDAQPHDAAPSRGDTSFLGSKPLLLLVVCALSFVVGRLSISYQPDSHGTGDAGPDNPHRHSVMIKQTGIGR